MLEAAQLSCVKGDSAGFLRLLFAPYTSPSARVELRCFPAPGAQAQPFRRWYTLDEPGIAACAKDALKLAETFECYMGVLPRVQGGGKAEHLRQCGWIWVDIDGGDETPTEATHLLLAAIRERGLPKPHLVVVSGGGIHCYWRLEQVAPCQTPEQRDAIRKVLLRLVRAIGGEAPKAHADKASTDPSRILRVAGTWNHKIEDEMRAVYLRWCEPDLPAYPFVWWQGHLPAEPLPPRPRYQAPGRSREVATFGKDGSLPPRMLEKLTQAASPGSKHFTMRDVAVAARKYGMDEGQVRNLAEQVGQVSGVDMATIQQQKHLDELVQWTMHNVMPDPGG